MSIHSIIVDDFFQNPEEIRKIALKLEFTPSLDGSYSGRRTASLKYTHAFIHREVEHRVLNYYNLSPSNYITDTYFHITGERSGKEGWVHIDYPAHLASVLYLNPDVKDIKSGTSLYDKNTGFEGPSQKEILVYRKAFIQDIDYVVEKEQNNSNYTKTAIIGGKFNRMIIYPGCVSHTGEGYFGNNVDDSRLTLVAFIFPKNN
jgi:hypothetical protein